MTTPSESADPSEGLAWVDAERILEKLGDQLADKHLILVGGQALNFWQTVFSDADPTLQSAPPMSSKDIDFCGDKTAVRKCALALGGEAFTPQLEDVATPSTGKVVFLDSTGTKRTIDFVECPYGLKLGRVRETALRAEIQKEDGTPSGVVIWVMHPVLCMFSRVHNTMSLPGYDTPHALRQLAMSVPCARAFFVRLLETGGDEGVKTVCKFAESIYHFCHDEEVGRAVAKKHGVDPFDAVPSDHPALPEGFRTRRYPQMKEYIRSRRERGGQGV